MVKKSRTINIQRVSGPALVPGLGITEQVAARISDQYTGFDTHNAYDSNKQIYTVPVSGVYQISTIFTDHNGSHCETQLRQVLAGDCLQIPEGQPFIQNDWVFIRANESIGIYKDWKVTIVESSYPMMVGTVLDVADHNMVKVPTESKLKSILVLYGKKD